jgi:hypothetical protein
LENPILTKLEDRLAFTKWMHILENWKQTQQWPDIYITKDSTGSSFQHWAIILKPLTLDIYKILNILDNKWYDIYTIIITKFKTFLIQNNIEHDKKLMNQVFVRTILKRCIMTANYNVTLWKSQQYLLESINEEYSELLYNIESKKQIIRLHKIFYRFLNHDLFLLLFQNSKEKSLLELCKSVENDFTYKKKTKLKKQIEINGKRCNLTILNYNKDIDEVKTKRALPANIIQAFDARLAEFLLKEVECISIHDAFLVHIYDLGLLIDKTNEYFAKQLNYSTEYSASPFSLI